MPKQLTYAFTDDWLIFAKDENGVEYYVSTEMWTQWLDCPKDADQEEDAIEKYMLPIAQQEWYELNWKLAETGRPILYSSLKECFNVSGIYSILPVNALDFLVNNQAIEDPDESPEIDLYDLTAEEQLLFAIFGEEFSV